MTHVGRFVLQTAMSGIVLIALQFVTFAFTTPPWDGGLATIGAPIGAAIFAFLTNSVVAIVGLPLRLVPPIRRWLETHPVISLAGALAGIGLIVASFIFAAPIVRLDDFGGPVPGLEPAAALYWSGWLLTAFAIVHLWFPRWGLRTEEDALQRRATALGENRQS